MDMKKRTLFILCLVAATGAFAQSHTFRDTSYAPYEQFDYDAWVMEDPAHNGKTIQNCPIKPGTDQSAMLNHDILQYNYTDNPAGMRVVGISAHVGLQKARINPYATPEYLLLYEATPDSFILKAQVRWFEDDTAGRPEGLYLINPLNCHNPSNDNGISYMSYVNNPYRTIRIFNMYFDKPVTVYDSFYVGGTSRFLSGLFDPEHCDSCGSQSSYITFVTSNTGMNDTTCFMPSLWKIWDYSGYGTNQWYWAPSTQFLMILPIIEVVDSSFANAPECPVVSGLFLRGNYTDTVTVQWDYDSLHPEYQLWYGPEADFETHNAMVSLRTNKWVFSDASYADTQMIAYVRTVCHEYDTLRYSEWGRPIRFRLHHEEKDTTGHGNIVVPEAGDDLARFVQMMPNPASGSVLVSSSYRISRVEAYDVRGEKVMEQPTEGRTAAFDVTAWPKGAYVVLVRTPQGTAAKRLVVQ